MNTLKSPHLMSIFCMVLLLPVSVIGGTMPDTAQNQCYNNENGIPCPGEGATFYGQDAQYEGPARSYTKVGKKGVALPDTARPADGWFMTRDNATGLMWEIKTDDGTVHDRDNMYTWYDPGAAVPGTPGVGTDTADFIAALNSAGFGGFKDWRMPTAKELATLIVNDGQVHPTIDTGFFPNTADHCYWSSTTYAPDPAEARGMGFEDGDDSRAPKSQLRCVRAVRGALSPVLGDAIGSGRLIDNGDGTVTDTETALMWQQATAPGKYSWEAALAYTDTLVLPVNGHSDWRIPNRNELMTILDYTRSSPATPPEIFPDTFYSSYWSSTTEAALPVNAWKTDFNNGSQSRLLKTSAIYVRGVRGGISGPSAPPFISQTPLFGLPGTRFVRKGEGFTPNSTAILYFSGTGIAEPMTQHQAIGADGGFEITSSFPDKPAGAFSWWGEDGDTGRWSNVVTYKIPCPLVGPRFLLLSE